MPELPTQAPGEASSGVLRQVSAIPHNQSSRATRPALALDQEAAVPMTEVTL